MKLLAIDTSSLAASVAVGEDGVLLGEFITNYKKTHSERIMPMVDGLLQSLGLRIDEMDGFVTSVGPGSFTGLRIGIATVKAFAQVSDKPVAAVKTTEMLAYHIAPTKALICPIMDARAGQVYNGVYVYQNGVIETVADARAVGLEDLIPELMQYKKQVIFLGDAAALYRDRLIAELGETALFAPAHLLMQRASALLAAGFDQIKEGRGLNAYEVAPFYLRKPQAERELEMKLEGKKG